MTTPEGIDCSELIDPRTNKPFDGQQAFLCKWCDRIRLAESFVRDGHNIEIKGYGPPINDGLAFNYAVVKLV